MELKRGFRPWLTVYVRFRRYVECIINSVEALNDYRIGLKREGIGFPFQEFSMISSGGYFIDDQVGSSTVPDGPSFAAGMVLGFDCNFTTGEYEILVDNASVGYSINRGANNFLFKMVPAINILNANLEDLNVTWNFRPQELIYAPPSGALPWLNL